MRVAIRPHNPLRFARAIFASVANLRDRFLVTATESTQLRSEIALAGPKLLVSWKTGSLSGC
jgi:hypothetical protein